MRCFILILLLTSFSLNSLGFDSVDTVKPNYETNQQNDEFSISDEELSGLEMKYYKVFQQNKDKFHVNLKNKPSKFQQIFGVMVDSFSPGSMTGFTPPVNY